MAQGTGGESCGCVYKVDPSEALGVLEGDKLERHVVVMFYEERTKEVEHILKEKEEVVVTHKLDLRCLHSLFRPINNNP